MGEGVTPALGALIGRCLEKAPAQRFQTASEVALFSMRYRAGLPKRIRCLRRAGGDVRF